MNLRTKNIELCLCEKTGSILSCRNGLGTEFAAETALPLASVSLMDEKGNRTLAGTDRAVLKETAFDGRCAVFRFAEVGGLPLEIQAKVRTDGEFIRFSLSLHNETGLCLEWIDYPGFLARNRMADQGGAFRAFRPVFEGLETDNFDLRDRYSPRQEFGYPQRGWDGFYPGSTSMQYMAYYDGEQGLYIGAHDSRLNMKNIDCYRTEAGIVFENKLIPGLWDNADYAYEYDVVFGGFEGDWYDAAGIYRRFAESSGLLDMPKLRDNRRIPDWVKDSPVVVVYPVRGEKDTGDMEPNVYYPYENALPYLKRLEEKLDSRLLVMLCHWEGSAPWAPPYVWPPYGDLQSFLKLQDELHRGGHRLGLYCSGTAWTNQSLLDPSYCMEETFEREGLREAMAIAPDQSLPHASICNGNIRWGYDLCTSTERARRIVLDEIAKILSNSAVDYLQYFDQNIGGTSSVCYANDHGHPHTPGRWQVEGMRELYRRTEKLLEERGLKGKVLFGCEGAAAEGYVEFMPFNDARNFGGYATGRPVPAYNFLFHEYLNNFMGNQNTTFYYLDVSQNPDNIFYRTAQFFSQGDILTVVLQDGGKLHWDWSSPWDLPEVPQEEYAAFVRLLAAWRRQGLREELAYGRMAKPRHVECGSERWIYKCGLSYDYPAVLTTRFLTEGGGDTQILVNPGREPRSARVQVGPGLKVLGCAEESGRDPRPLSPKDPGVLELELAPRSVLKLIFIKEENIL